MSFNYDEIDSVEFGVCHGSLNEGQATLVPVDEGVQALLQEMVKDTIDSMGLTAEATDLDEYEPSQEHAADSKLALPTTSPLAGVLVGFHDAENQPVDAHAMREPETISAYFCVLHDRDGEKLVGIRRASQFKAVLGARLIQFLDDSFRAVDDHVFKLDHDFDVIIVDETILINRVAAFELLAEIDEQVQEAAVENARQLGERLPFIEFDKITRYVADHKRAARLIAALSAREDLGETTLTNLRRECRRSGVQVSMVNGQIIPDRGQEMALLQVLDRRRYALMLVNGRWEQYEAGSRKSAGVRQEAAPERAGRRARHLGARG